jgi:hypothetical protein
MLQVRTGTSREGRKAAMDRYVGVDVHASSCTFAVLNSSGKLLRRDVVETNGAALVGYVKRTSGNVHLCLEESGWSQWLVEILSPHAEGSLTLTLEKQISRDSVSTRRTFELSIALT